MDQQTLEKLRGRADSCPSNTDLNQLHTGELDAQAAAGLERHVASCPDCQSRMAMRKAGFAAIPDVDSRRLLDAIQRRGRQQDKPKLARKRSWPRRAAYVLTSLAAAAALSIVVLGQRTQTPTFPDESPGVREKGARALYVYKLIGDRAERTVSGDHFKSGDQLRFVVDLPSPGHINVFGVEASGEIYVAWPRSEGVSTLRAAGKQQELPGAAALDNSGGRETLYLVHCPVTVGPPAVVCQIKNVHKPASPPSCPNDCVQTPFVLNKSQD